MSTPAFAVHAAAALEAQFAVFGVPATWTPAAGGDAVPCTVIKLSPDAEVTIGSSRGRTATNMIYVRVAEVAAVQQHDVIQITGGPQLKVLVTPPADDFGLLWACEVG